VTDQAIDIQHLDADVQHAMAILEQLRASDITWSIALTLSGQETATKPWQTVAWKRRRDTLIGEACEQCSSASQPLVLQHMHQPRKFGDIAYAIRGEIMQRIMFEHPLTPHSEAELAERQACPACKSVNITWQNTLSRWKCNHQRCGQVFEQPITVRALTAEIRRARKERGREAYQREIQPLLDGCKGEIMHRATLLSLEEHIRYLRCEDTVTFCKKCAFLWDKKGLRLCRRCYEHYHSFGYAVCWDCKQAASIEEAE
jgi:hypothetical protein